MPSLSSVHFCTSLSPLFVFSSIYLPLSFHSPFLCICPNVCLLVSSCGSRFCSLSVLELIHLESVLKHQPGAPSLPPFCFFFILLLYSNPVLFQSVAFFPFSAFPLPVACHYLLDFSLSWCVLMCFSTIFCLNCLLLCFAPLFLPLFTHYRSVISQSSEVFSVCCVVLMPFQQALDISIYTYY